MDIKSFKAFSSELIKLAKLGTKLQPHQERVVNRISQEDQPGLLVVHGLGSGKSYAAIAAQNKLKLPSDVVVPASLQANFAKEIKKHHGKGSKFHIQSMQNLAVKNKSPTREMLIVDEAHRARDAGSKTFEALSKNTAKKRLLLSGSPLYNRPSDLAPLINMAAGQTVLPTSQTDFEKKYIKELKIDPGLLARLRGIKPGIERTVDPKKEKELKRAFKKWVDYYEGSKENFPEVSEEEIKTPMTGKQQDVYDATMGTAPEWVRYKVKKGLPPNKQESTQLNAYLSGVRQISNSTAPFMSQGDPEDPKIQRAFSLLNRELSSNPRSKAVVYSNFLEAGINPYKKRLEEAGIPYGEFTGTMPKAKRDELVKAYNANKIRTLLLSSAGGEGLDLKGTRLMQILEPHWNKAKIDQVVGRGARFQSHEKLPESERNMKVQKFLSTRAPKGLFERLGLAKPGYGVDEYLANTSVKKERLNKQFRELMQQAQQEYDAEQEAKKLKAKK